MSAIRGFTASGVALGGLSGVKNISFPSLAQTLERVRTAGDANDAGTNIYSNYVEGPIVVTFRWNASLRSALLAKARAGTTDTFSFTKTGYCTYSGAGCVQNVGDQTFNAENDPEFSVTFESETEWTYATA
jgi:hypothetical protein